MTAKTATRPYRIATPEKINAACRAIELRGEKITVHGVRDEVGGGCFNTIGPVVKQYKKSGNSNLPERAQRMQTAAANSLWDMAMSTAREEVASREDALTRKLQKSENDLKAARAVTVQVTKNAKDTADEHRRQIAILQGEKHDATVRADQFETKARRTTRAEALAETETARANAAEKQVSTTKGQLTKAEKKAAAAEARVAELHEALEAMKSEVSEAKQRAVVAELDLESATAENTRLTAQIAEQRTGAPLASAFRELIGRGRQAA